MEELAGDADDDTVDELAEVLADALLDMLVEVLDEPTIQGSEMTLELDELEVAELELEYWLYPWL